MPHAGKFVVIGAGLSGLTSAYFLKAAGHEVIVLERDSRPGGRIQSAHYSGDTVEMGAQFIHTNYRLTLDLCKEFNLESNLVEMKSDDMIVREGRIHIIPWGSIRVPAVSLWSQIKLLRLIIPMLIRWKGMALDGWERLLDIDRLELAAYARMKLNEESLEYIVRPLMLTYSMSEPEGISVAYFLRSAKMYLTTGAHCFRNGNDALPKSLSQHLDIRYDTEVRSVLHDEGGKACAVRTSEGGEIEATAVISAIPPSEIFPLSSGWNSEQIEFFQEFAFSRMPLVLFKASGLDAITYWGGVLERKAGHRVSFLTYPHRKFDQATRHQYLQAWPLGSLGEELVDLSDEKIVDTVVGELTKIIPDTVSSLEAVSVNRYPNTFPQFKVGMFNMLARFKASETHSPGLYFAGDYTEGGLIEGAAQSGYKAARRILAAYRR